TYSHYVMPNGLVTSFIDSVPVPTPNPKDLQYRIGGTEAPTVRIELVGDRSFVVETLDFGYIPAMRDVQLKEKSNLISDIDSIFGSIVKGIFG
ncbi:glycoside hydrolase family 68 protein, partial [Acinetobacter nectaris]